MHRSRGVRHTHTHTHTVVTVTDIVRSTRPPPQRPMQTPTNHHVDRRGEDDGPPRPWPTAPRPLPTESARANSAPGPSSAVSGPGRRRHSNLPERGVRNVSTRIGGWDLDSPPQSSSCTHQRGVRIEDAQWEGQAAQKVGHGSSRRLGKLRTIEDVDPHDHHDVGAKPFTMHSHGRPLDRMM